VVLVGDSWVSCNCACRMRKELELGGIFSFWNSRIHLLVHMGGVWTLHPLSSSSRVCWSWLSLSFIGSTVRASSWGMRISSRAEAGVGISMSVPVRSAGHFSRRVSSYLQNSSSQHSPPHPHHRHPTQPDWSQSKVHSSVAPSPRNVIGNSPKWRERVRGWGTLPNKPLPDPSILLIWNSNLKVTAYFLHSPALTQDAWRTPSL